MGNEKDEFVLKGTEAEGIYVRYKTPYKKIGQDNDEGQLIEICPIDKVEERLNHLAIKCLSVFEEEFYHKPVVVIDREEYMKFKGVVE